jgi:hypothetical protein
MLLDSVREAHGHGVSRSQLLEMVRQGRPSGRQALLAFARQKVVPFLGIVLLAGEVGDQCPLDAEAVHLL